MTGRRSALSALMLAVASLATAGLSAAAQVNAPVANASAPNAPVKGVEVHFDPAKTQIRWHLGGAVHSTNGTFKLKGGALVLNTKTGLAEGELLVDATSGESGDGARDRRMHKEILESGRYPAIFFHPSHIQGDLRAAGGVQRITAQGTFNIHGADHPLDLPVEVTIAGNMVTATTHFTVPYVAWGMKDPSQFVLRVDKQVQVDVMARGSITGLK